MRRRPGAEDGAVGGVEALPFGFLVFVIGMLVVANAWGVIDAKLAVTAAAREAARAYVEAPDAAAAGRAAEVAAHAALRGHGRDPERLVGLDVPGPDRFHRCARVVLEVRYRVPSLPLPWIGGFGPGGFTVRGTHSEVVDPYRDDVPFAPGLAEAQC